MTSKEINLQLFSEDKREPATPRRRQIAREKGQVAMSQELGTAAGLIVGVISLRYLWPISSDYLAKKAVQIWSSQVVTEPTVGWALKVLRDVILTIGMVSLPLSLSVLLAGTVAFLCQVGLSFHLNFIMPDFSKVNPFEGTKRLFSKRALENLFLSLMKLILISYLAFAAVKTSFNELSSLLLRDLKESLTFLGDKAWRVAVSVSLSLFILGAIDYVYRFWQHEKSLMMSQEELKEELKETEGKPEVKNAIRRRQRAIAQRRMMQDVPKSDVVIVNPNHYAVALKYDPKEYPAPLVLAKGLDELALRIKEIARKEGVHIVENPPLAQGLYKVCDVGQMIPQEMYQAVAEVLAYVYRLSGKMPMEGSVS